MIDELDKKILKRIQKQVVSGEILAKDLGVTRTAIWKRIKKLKQAGYQIKSTPKGYLLLDNKNLLLENEVKPLLNTSLIGREYLYFDQIDSTNRYAKTHPLKEGTVVIAQRQTAGKGRKDRRWLSTGKGIYFSLVLEPKLPIDELLRFSALFPYVVRKTVEIFTKKEVGIKWPNDIFLNGKKVSGILIESEIEAERINRLIVGIGLNVNDTVEDLEQIKDTATSMLIETGKNFSKKEILSFLLDEIEKEYIKFLSNIDFRKSILKELNRYLLWKGKKIKVFNENQTLEGILIGINENGAVLIKKGKSINVLYSGDISLRKEDV
ncbi:MAG: biotin--[acetyl-CoA-carboxylase] ligase [Aquificae bacterium]|nr:biotin--[acetyl-CoA-carboxylase] ligase [Aquificota bacterium]